MHDLTAGGPVCPAKQVVDETFTLQPVVRQLMRRRAVYADAALGEAYSARRPESRLIRSGLLERSTSSTLQFSRAPFQSLDRLRTSNWRESI